MSVGKEYNTVCFHYSPYLHNSCKHLNFNSYFTNITMKERENWVSLQYKNGVRNDMSWKNLRKYRWPEIEGEGKYFSLKSHFFPILASCWILLFFFLVSLSSLSFSLSPLVLTFLIVPIFSLEIVFQRSEVGWTCKEMKSKANNSNNNGNSHHLLSFSLLATGLGVLNKLT